ncbi:MAG: TatD family hydrolase [Atopobiaceae bacterium]|jgi:TatD DNase family protein|nr:TatD family hydrolase [Atopobiaceae bacterium]MCH4180280.1 TatD family hydrolase [Atopobiaceae bacterium]MCH4214766.1 TatD family hydrolase [Atopobiaceae bacterium]MCH4229992.1 TatD family hydrolase [Atopobiaceae bacterium]MCH4276925.1 TatD family hydrolase [Atopobiaceae bacterium]
MSQELVCEDDLTLEDGELFHSKKGRVLVEPAPLAPLADTHGHLTVISQHDPARAIARAALAGVRLLVTPLDPVDDRHDMDAVLADLTAWQDRARGLLADAVKRGHVPPVWQAHPGLPELPDNVRLVAGAHPYGALEFDDAARARMGRMLADPRCVGVGEIGLDYTCDVPHDAQLACFSEQLAMARERDLPVELHIRDVRDDPSAEAHADAAALLAREGVPDAGCDLHCFTNDVEVVRPFLELGCHVAFGGAATFKRSDDIREAAVAVPLGRLLSETDCPYMAPVPLRGQECEPAMVCFSAACVADAREAAGVSTRLETYEALWANACELFG